MPIISLRCFHLDNTTSVGGHLRLAGLYVTSLNPSPSISRWDDGAEKMNDDGKVRARQR